MGLQPGVVSLLPGASGRPGAPQCTLGPTAAPEETCLVSPGPLAAPRVLCPVLTACASLPDVRRLGPRSAPCLRASEQPVFTLWALSPWPPAPAALVTAVILTDENRWGALTSVFLPGFVVSVGPVS